MAVEAAGLLVFKRNGDSVQVLLTHPGGPIWSKKDVWSIPKGELDDGEDYQKAAFREFAEELNAKPPEGELIDLGSAQQSHKTNFIWAVEGDVNLADFKSNTFVIEWPPKSGRQQEFPENDRAAWFEISVARQKVFEVQQIFFDRLSEYLGINLVEPPTQQSLL